MKNLKFALVFLVAGILSSCLDTEEKIVMNANNSGNYALSIDLSKMLEMAASMGGDQSGPDKVKQKKDTTIYIKDMLNNAENLSAEEKALYKDATINVKLDEVQNQMKIVMSTPFNNASDLMEIKKNFPGVMNKLKAFEKATGEEGKEPGDGADMKMGAKSTNPVGDQFSFLAGKGIISNTINDIEAYKKNVAADSSLNMMTQMTSMTGDFNYRTIIVLPKAVKKYDGPGSIISPDKKTITFNTTLSEMLEHPEKVSYTVSY